MEFPPFTIYPLPFEGPRRFVQFDNWTVPEHFIAAAPGVELEIKLDEQGKARCLSLTVRNEQDVTSEALRRVPVARLRDEAVAMAGAKYEPVEEGGEPVFQFSTPFADRVAFYERYARDTRSPRSGSPLSDEHLRQVAELYRAALKHSDPPTKTVAEAMHVARSTAARWVAAARQRGMLGPAMPGKGGEGKS